MQGPSSSTSTWADGSASVQCHINIRRDYRRQKAGKHPAMGPQKRLASSSPIDWTVHAFSLRLYPAYLRAKTSSIFDEPL
jgi:hypothetical protein